MKHFSTNNILVAGNTFFLQPKLILPNLKLPKADGLETLRKIKSKEAPIQIPVAILTPSKEEKDTIENYKLRVNNYIVKPLNFESFIKAVAEPDLYWLLLNQRPVYQNRRSYALYNLTEEV